MLTGLDIDSKKKKRTQWETSRLQRNREERRKVSSFALSHQHQGRPKKEEAGKANKPYFCSRWPSPNMFELILHLALFFSFLAVYCWTMFPSVSTLNSAELVSAAFNLGLPHPPVFSFIARISLSFCCCRVFRRSFYSPSSSQWFSRLALLGFV